MSIKNLFLGDLNRTLDVFCNRVNCGDIDIQDNKIKYVKEITSNIINGTHLYIRNMNVYDYIMSLERNTETKRLNDKNELENKITILQNQIDELKKVINELTNINLVS